MYVFLPFKAMKRKEKKGRKKEKNEYKNKKEQPKLRLSSWHFWSPDHLSYDNPTWLNPFFFWNKNIPVNQVHVHKHSKKVNRQKKKQKQEKNIKVKVSLHQLPANFLSSKENVHVDWWGKTQSLVHVFQFILLMMELSAENIKVQT